MFTATSTSYISLCDRSFTWCMPKTSIKFKFLQLISLIEVSNCSSISSHSVSRALISRLVILCYVNASNIEKVHVEFLSKTNKIIELQTTANNSKCPTACFGGPLRQQVIVLYFRFVFAKVSV